MALVKNASSFPRAIGPRDNSRLLRLPLRYRSTRDSRLYRSSCSLRLACETDSKHFPDTTKSQATLENARPSRSLLIGTMFFLLQERSDHNRRMEHDFWSINSSRLRETSYLVGEERVKRPPESRPDNRCIRLLRALLR